MKSYTVSVEAKCVMIFVVEANSQNEAKNEAVAMLEGGDRPEDIEPVEITKVKVINTNWL